MNNWQWDHVAQQNPATTHPPTTPPPVQGFGPAASDEWEVFTAADGMPAIRPAASDNAPRPDNTKDVYERAGRRRNDPPEKFVSEDEFMSATTDDLGRYSCSACSPHRCTHGHRASDDLYDDVTAAADALIRAPLTQGPLLPPGRQEQPMSLKLRARIAAVSEQDGAQHLQSETVEALAKNLLTTIGDLTAQDLGAFIEFNDDNNYRREGVLVRLQHERGFNGEPRTYIAIRYPDEAKWSKHLSSKTPLISYTD